MGRSLKPAVIYLERFENSSQLGKDFHESRVKYTAGTDYDYYHVLKGFPKPIDRVHIIHVPDVGFALSSLVRVCKQIENETILFFNSYSRILADNWLLSYLKVSKIENCGIVGATGSYEVNPHIRTNAFMINRALFLKLAPDLVTQSYAAGYPQWHESACC